MAQIWYYVLKGEILGPVDEDALKTLFNDGVLKKEDFIWKKGFGNWKKAFEVEEIASFFQVEKKPDIPATPSVKPGIPEPLSKLSRLGQLPEEERCIFIRIGRDRADSAMTEYGPFDLKQIKKMYKENRINGKTEIFSKDIQEWTFLADFKDYEEFFLELPPPITESDRRIFIRRPFLARLFIQNNKKVFEGICRDVSIGGMQVLVDHFPGSAAEKISINVHPDNSDYHFVASGTIVRLLEGKSGFSFRFEGLNDEARLAIEKYIHDTDQRK